MITDWHHGLGTEFRLLLEARSQPATEDEHRHIVRAGNLRHPGECGRKQRLRKGESKSRTASRLGSQRVNISLALKPSQACNQRLRQLGSSHIHPSLNKGRTSFDALKPGKYLLSYVEGVENGGFHSAPGAWDSTAPPASYPDQKRPVSSCDHHRSRARAACTRPHRIL